MQVAEQDLSLEDYWTDLCPDRFPRKEDLVLVEPNPSPSEKSYVWVRLIGTGPLPGLIRVQATDDLQLVVSFVASGVATITQFEVYLTSAALQRISGGSFQRETLIHSGDTVNLTLQLGWIP